MISQCFLGYINKYLDTLFVKNRLRIYTYTNYPSDGLLVSSINSANVTKEGWPSLVVNEKFELSEPVQCVKKANRF